MTRSASTSFVPLIAALSLLLAAPSLTAQRKAKDPTVRQEKTLRKRLADVESKIAREEKRLGKSKTECKAEYDKLFEAGTQAKLGTLLETVRANHLDAITKSRDAKAERAVKKDVLGALTEAVGVRVAGAFGEILGDELIGNIGAEDFNGQKLVANAVEDTFSKDFDSDFDSYFKTSLSSSLGKLIQERNGYKLEIDRIIATREARMSGLPSGMAKVEAGTHEIGVDAKQLKDFAKLMQFDLEKRWMLFCATPAHKVKLAEYLIDVDEVTSEAYMAFLKDTGRKAYPKHWAIRDPEDPKNKDKFKGYAVPKGWNKRPVTGITWNDAQAFARWIGRRLPTEYEWEAAARYGRTKRHRHYFTWGDTPPTTERCNSELNFEDPRRPRSFPGVKIVPPVINVGSFPKGANSKLKVNDMCGNAAEYTSSTFKPYAGFKKVKLKHRWVDESQFNLDEISIRGGHGNNRAELTSTFWRIGANKVSPLELVGFRTAASTIKGKDHLEAILDDFLFKRTLPDYAPLTSDEFADRKHAALAIDDPQRYTCIQAGGWNEGGLPTRARFISIVNRKCTDLRSVTHLDRFSTKEKPLLIGFLHLDVAVKEPGLEPGDYYVMWRPSFTEEIKDDEPEEGDDKKKKKRKKSKKNKKKGKRVPESIIFHNVRKTKEHRVALPMDKLPPTESRAQPTSIFTQPDGSGVDLVFAFPRRSKRDPKNLVVTIPLKLDPKVLAEFE